MSEIARWSAPWNAAGEYLPLGEAEGMGYEEFGDDVGKIRIWHLGGRIGIFESSGAINGEHAKFIVAYFKRHIESRSAPYFAFGNWLHLEAYTPDTRKILTEWQLGVTYDELHVAQTSKLLAMSVGMANAVLPRKVQTHATLEGLESALAKVRLAHDL